MKAFRLITLVVAIMALFYGDGFSQESKEELAKAAQNPLANMNRKLYLIK